MMEFDYPAEANLLIGRAITLDNEIKAKKKELDAYLSNHELDFRKEADLIGLLRYMQAL